MEMDATPSDSETATPTNAAAISSNINVHPIKPRHQLLLQLVKEVRSSTECLIGATQLCSSSDLTNMSIKIDSAST
jgi:hypothetical protein